jgi:hypothetical protein
VGPRVQQQSVAHALHHMMSNKGYGGSHFSVCTVEKCARLCGVVIPGDRLRVYNSAHGIDWSDMTPEFRQMLCAMVLDDFREVLMADV